MDISRQYFYVSKDALQATLGGQLEIATFKNAIFLQMPPLKYKHFHCSVSKKYGDSENGIIKMMSLKSGIFWLLLYTKRNMMIDGFFDAMTAPISYDWAALLARLAVGLALLPYGIDKCMNRGNAVKFHKVLFFSPAAGFYCVMVIETLVPIFLIFGMFTRLVVVPAIFSFAIAAKLTLGKYGKSPALLFFLMMIVIFCIGGGNYSLDHYLGIWVK